ncbi:GUN4-like protein [Chondrocystis sp. NIES-4102]|nr:GUN4-like protein [Chondrocystis sp. NIES-4102]
MKYLGRINKFLMAGTVGATIAFSICLVKLKPSVASASIIKLAQILSPEEVNLRAKPIIVRIDGANVGSGTLIDYSNKVYTVLTNWHVMQNTGEYIVQTIDGRTHKVDPASIKQLPGLDLAILKFTSDQNYQIAQLGNSANLNEGQSIYFAGYPGELRREDNRYYRFFTVNLVGILPKATENGYSIIYNGEAFPGMSGGPVFNQEGLMIGVHGEANVNAISGGTSNYAIGIDSYRQAIAKLNTTPPANNTTVAKPPQAPATNPPTNNSTAAKPEDSNNVVSVPTFISSSPKPTQNTEVKSPPAEGDLAKPTEVEKKPEVIVTSPKPTQVEKKPEIPVTNQPTEVKPQSQTPVTNQPTEDKPQSPTPTQTVDLASTEQRVTLISQKTGIDYTTLKNLLKEQKWSEADIHTYKLIEQIVKTAKRENPHIFIELKSIAEFSCPDIRTIDYLWKQYSGNKFGFSSQQEVWQSVNQKGDFSTETWRNFATKVGWKKGDVASSSGYLLYNQLNFNPKEAPAGHLPWWFALPEEEQKVIKHLFAQCNFNPNQQELEASNQKNHAQNTTNLTGILNKNKSRVSKIPKSLQKLIK